jgi:hypothetical protein
MTIWHPRVGGMSNYNWPHEEAKSPNKVKNALKNRSKLMRFFLSSSVSEGYWKEIFHPMRHHTADIEAMGLWERNIPPYAAPYAPPYGRH